MMASSEAAPHIVICDVGPRDGLQSEDRIWSVAERVELIDRLSASGLRRMEAVSFVHPKRVPQMAGAEEVMAAIKRPDSVQFAGLALNLRGAERAIDAGVDVFGGKFAEDVLARTQDLLEFYGTKIDIRGGVGYLKL